MLSTIKEELKEQKEIVYDWTIILKDRKRKLNSKYLIGHIKEKEIREFYKQRIDNIEKILDYEKNKYKDLQSKLIV